MMKLTDGIQTNYPVLESLEDLKMIMVELGEIVSWSNVGILFDKENKSTLILLLDKKFVINGVLRFSLEIVENIEAINLLKRDGEVFLGSSDRDFSLEDIRSLSRLNAIWVSIAPLYAKPNNNELEEFFLRTRAKNTKLGRGKSFSKNTINSVIFESHGYCMFDGCGEDLTKDETTGKRGNFSYLAHNIASSENGARGSIVMSGILADNPDNVLLLCDKHHRLVDRIATIDYPSNRLSQMKVNFNSTCSNLLNSLAYQPVPAFSILWPVAGNSVSGPTEIEISQCLSTSKTRLSNQLNTINDNESFLKATSDDAVWSIIAGEIERAANGINMQLHSYNYKAALFAFGPMPSLIALGAKLGNKNGIIPMMRFRDGGRWTWPSDRPLGKFYDLNGIEDLTSGEEEVIILLATTSNPRNLANAAEQIAKNKNAKVIEIRSKELGNGALAHPNDGIAFSADIQRLFHRLKSDFGVRNIHLLPCASNAVCVFFGQAFDNYHPNLTIYDFHKKTMIPRLIVENKNNECRVVAAC